MKKALCIFLILSTVSGAVYSSVEATCEGNNRFVKDLNLDQERADKVQKILSSYSEIKDLYKTGQQAQIPDFLAQREAELSEVLTPAELAQFKENVGKWAEQKDFTKFMKFSSWDGNSANEGNR